MKSMVKLNDHFKHNLKEAYFKKDYYLLHDKNTRNSQFNKIILFSIALCIIQHRDVSLRYIFDTPVLLPTVEEISQSETFSSIVSK